MGGSTKHEIKLSRGLVGQDDNIDVLTNLFEQLQLVTVETAGLELDLITFAESAHYFAVILEGPAVPSTQTQEQPDRQLLEEHRDQTRGESWGRQREQFDSDIKPFDFLQESNETFTDPPLSPSPSASTDQSDNDDGPMNLWDPEWRSNDAQTSPLVPIHWPNREETPIGLVYLAASQNFRDPLHVGELSIGIIIDPEYREKGYAREVLQRVARIAFDEAKCHRLQAILLGHVAMDRALSLFTKMNFAHEGTRRRSFFSPMQHEWQDATYMAILATDWVMRGAHVYKSAPKSVWDALFARHQREREDLLRWEAKTTLKRTSSATTVRGELDTTHLTTPDPAPTPSSTSEAEFDNTSQSGKRKADAMDNPFDSPDDERRMLVNRWVELSPAALSFDEALSDGSASPGSSASWDVMETSDNPSSPGSSMFEFINA